MFLCPKITKNSVCGIRFARYKYPWKFSQRSKNSDLKFPRVESALLGQSLDLRDPESNPEPAIFGFIWYKISGYNSIRSPFARFRDLVQTEKSKFWNSEIEKRFIMINEFSAIESFVNPLLYRTSVTPRSDKVPIRQFEATWLTDFRDIQRG